VKVFEIAYMLKRSELERTWWMVSRRKNSIKELMIVWIYRWSDPRLPTKSENNDSGAQLFWACKRSSNEKINQFSVQNTSVPRKISNILFSSPLYSTIKVKLFSIWLEELFYHLIRTSISQEIHVYRQILQAAHA